MKASRRSNFLYRYEIITLVRQRWIQFLVLILLGLVLFAVVNGKQKVDQRLGDIQEAQQTVIEKDSLGVILLDSIEAGFTVDVPRWYMPNQPHVVGYNYTRVAAMPPDNLAIIATGQSDIFAHYVQPNLYGESFELNYTELSNPVQLMFGSFDLSFVLIYLLPLIVIAFTYNILSAEKEQGILQVIASHPVSLFQWLLQKSLIRYLLLTGILVVLLVASLSVAGILLFSDFDRIMIFILLTMGYTLFWFVLACLVNLKGKSSANNAVWLISMWILLVLLVPSSVNQMANSLYPVPSRARLINELRVVNAEAEKKADELLENFLRDHPELAGFEGGSRGWKEYFATQDLIKNEIQPVLDEYEVKLEQQQAWVNRLRLASPALILQNSFNEISGTSTSHYEDYRQQISDFSLTWRNYFLPRIFKGEAFTKAMMVELPEFEYQPSTSYGQSAGNTSILFIYCVVLLGFGVVISRQSKIIPSS